MKYTVSVIIPVYKTEKFVGRCLNSLTRQTFTNYEVVIVNDCSPDGAMNVVNDYANADSRIKIVEHVENKGSMCARHSGYKVATGKYYMFLDSDDTLPDNAIQTLVDAIESCNADIVVAGFRKVWETKNHVKVCLPKVLGEFTPNETFRLLLAGKMTHNLAFAIFNADLFNYEYLTLPNQVNGEDLILFYQLVDKSRKIMAINHISYNYYQDGTSSTRSAIDENKLRQLVNVQNFKLHFMKKRGISNEAIMSSIVPHVANWYSCAAAKIVIPELDREIQYALTIKQILKYLTLREKIKYIIRRIKNYL